MPCSPARRLLQTAAILALAAAPALGQRAIGIDVSYWQSNNTKSTTVSAIDWATVAKPQSLGGGGIDFAFIRASRGGTIGSNVSAGGGAAGTGAMRYDDPYFEDNMNRARANGILAAPYHYARLDRIGATDPAFPGYTGNTGLDEANHYLEKAGAYMRPGWLRPVLDLEGGNEVTAAPATITAFALEFSDRILAVTGVRPIIYVNSSWARDRITSALNTHDLWLARYIFLESSGSTPEKRAAAAAQAQTEHPPTPNNFTHPYGIFRTATNQHPRDFWQYTDGGRTPGISGNVDQNVANGDKNWIRETFTIPAIWMADADGSWGTPANWNGKTVLPTAADRVILNRTTGNYLVTLDNGVQNVRSLQLNERLTIGGFGSLKAAEYANVANTLTVSNGSFEAPSIVNTSTINQSVGLIVADAITGTGTLSLTGGTLRAKSIKANNLTLTGGTAELLGSATSVVKALSVTAAGVLDIGDAGVVVDYAGAVSPLASIRSSLSSARAGGAWTGPGIDSSTLGVGEGIAYLESSSLFTDFTTATFRGERVDSTAVLLVKAIVGDTNLDGNVDFDDLLRIAGSYNTSATWRNGDFTLDGTTDFDDLLGLAANYSRTGASPLTLPAAFSADLQADWALAQSLIPEPTSLWFVAAGCALGARRPRSRARA